MVERISFNVCECVCVRQWRDVCGKLNTPLTARIFVRRPREGYRGLARISLFLFQFDSINVRFTSRNAPCSGFVWVHSLIRSKIGRP